MTGLRYHERAFIAGPSESGKSELLNVLFSEFACQRLLYDTKGHEWTIPGVDPVSDPAAIDWRVPIVHYVTAGTDVAEADEVFSQAEKRRDLVVCVHELGDLCEYETNRTPASVNRYLAQGGANGRGFLGASQEPVDMPKRAKKEINRLYVVVPPMDDDHLRVVAPLARRKPRELTRDLEEAEREHGPHTFIEYPRGVQEEATVWPPLPDWKRAESIVSRRQAHARERSR